MAKDVKKIFDETLAPFPGARWVACWIDDDFPVWKMDGRYNYALLVYIPYDSLMTLEDYEEERQFAQRNRGQARMKPIREALLRRCEEEGIPFQFPPGSIDHMSPPYITPLSNKCIGWKGGAGWIGRNNLLITYEYGARIFTLGAVFYAKELETRAPVTKSECGDCELCISSCPFKNIYGQEWDPEISRDQMVNYHMCSLARFRVGQNQGLGRKITCAKCLLVCPRGKENIEKFIEKYYPRG